MSWLEITCNVIQSGLPTSGSCQLIFKAQKKKERLAGVKRMEWSVPVKQTFKTLQQTVQDPLKTTSAKQPKNYKI